MTSTKKHFSSGVVSLLRKATLDTDQALMDRVRQGDRKAFELLYERFKRPIMSYLVLSLRDRRLAEELTQEIFLKTYRARESYVPSAKFSTWLWTIARHSLLDHFKKTDPITQSLRHFTADAEAVDEDPFPPTEITAEMLLIEKTHNQDIRDCMEKLTPSQKEAIHLRIFSELSYDEIAETLKISLTSVKTLLNRGKQALIDCMNRKAMRI